MRVLAVDPGAERCGLAIIDSDPLKHVWSDIVGVKRGAHEYQPYRVGLIKFWSIHALSCIRAWKPDVLVSETVPVKGGNFGAMAQMNLAATVITTIQTIAFYAKIQVVQIGATTVKKQIGGSNKASKVKVRNGVYSLLPETKRLKRFNWSKIFDESDAHAVGLAYLNYDIRKVNDNS